MRRIFFSSWFAPTMSLLAVATLSAQKPGKEKPRPAQNAGYSLAKKTIDAARNKDPWFVSKVADDTGIVMGWDTPVVSAARVRKEPASKRGVYCVIFDPPCPKGGFVTSPNCVFLTAATHRAACNLKSSGAGAGREIRSGIG